MKEQQRKATHQERAVPGTGTTRQQRVNKRVQGVSSLGPSTPYSPINTRQGLGTPMLTPDSSLWPVQASRPKSSSETQFKQFFSKTVPRSPRPKPHSPLCPRVPLLILLLQRPPYCAVVTHTYSGLPTRTRPPSEQRPCWLLSICASPEPGTVPSAL